MSIVAVLSTAQRAIGPHGRWAVIGAVARNAWAPPRATTDLDLTVVADSQALCAVADALARSRPTLPHGRVRVYIRPSRPDGWTPTQSPRLCNGDVQ